MKELDVFTSLRIL